MLKKSIPSRLSEKYEIPEEQVVHIVNDFWKSLNYYLRHPDECGIGIMLPVIKFDIYYHRVIKDLERLQRYKPSSSPKLQQSRDNKIQTYLKILENYERLTER